MKSINSGLKSEFWNFLLKKKQLAAIRVQWLVGEEAVLQSFQGRDPSQGVKGQHFLLKKKEKMYDYSVFVYTVCDYSYPVGYSVWQRWKRICRITVSIIVYSGL